jgi:ribonuclease D
MQVNPAIADMLRVLLKGIADREGVASKLIATASDLDAIAAGHRDVDALKGWRRQVFGDVALRMCDGKIALRVKGSAIETVDLGG